MLDFHSHLIPGVDDGAVDVEEARAGVAAMLADGVTGIITTPHIGASLIERGMAEPYLEKIAAGWDTLQTMVAAEFPKLRIARGFEVMLDVPHPKLDNPIFRLGGTAFALVEFPFMNIPPNSTHPLRELRDAGLMPILAHPERYVNIEQQVGLVEHWRDAGAFMQVNAGSLLGNYGSRAKKVAWTIVEEGQASYVCSDYHSRGKCSMAAAFAALREKGMDMQADAFVFNAKRVIRGERPMSVEPFSGKKARSWKKVFPWA
ncbi:MAG TPA: CpsB/CapC family capsule biosynthesis tyrosine phosphatase [Gemmatimonadaceae bacterium]|nr:CpsB/CapC family capsule biosynthesis tyrosine phosphatase [Gemmatimonadaceae bacterium]